MSKVLTLTFALVLSAFGSNQAKADAILALGDSLTQGYGLIEQDGLVPQLRNYLAERDITVRVVNAGVSGDTSAGGLARVEWSLTNDITHMIVALGGNDVLRGLQPEVTRDNIDQILAIGQEYGLKMMVVGMLAPANYGADYKQSFDSLFPELAQKYDALYVESFFSAFLTGPDQSPEDVQPYLQSDGLHPNAEGVEKIVEFIGPEVEKLLKK